MTSLRKHIIPLQKENLELAFNIQSYDTIKYSAKNIATELDRAIKDAIRITEAKEQDDKKTSFSEKTLLRRFELNGLELRDDEWILYDSIEDTNFKGFGQYDKRFYVYLGKIDDPSEFQDYLEDLGVVLYRTEKKAETIENELSDLNKRKEEIISKKKADKGQIHMLFESSSSTNEFNPVVAKITDIKSKLTLMATIFIGFIIQPDIKSGEFISDAEKLINQYKRYELRCSKDDVILLGDIEVSLTGETAH